MLFATDVKFNIVLFESNLHRGLGVPLGELKKRGYVKRTLADLKWKFLMEPNSQCMIQNDYLRVKQCRYGWMMYNINDDPIGISLEVYGEWAQKEMALLMQFCHPEDYILDIGAHIGTHTLFFAACANRTTRVMCFEPQRLLYQMLCGNIALNALTRVIAMQAAVSDHARQVHVPIMDPHRKANFGGLQVMQCRSGESVAVVTIDQLNWPRCNLMKIDVEGSEEGVLAGAIKTIKCFRPTIYLENQFEDKSPALIAFLYGLDYRCWWHIYHRFNPNNYFKNKVCVFSPKSIECNMLCLHKSVDITKYNLSGLEPVLDTQETPYKAWQRINLRGKAP